MNRNFVRHQSLLPTIIFSVVLHALVIWALYQFSGESKSTLRIEESVLNSYLVIKPTTTIKPEPKLKTVVDNQPDTSQQTASLNESIDVEQMPTAEKNQTKKAVSNVNKPIIVQQKQLDGVQLKQAQPSALSSSLRHLRELNNVAIQQDATQASGQFRQRFNAALINTHDSIDTHELQKQIATAKVHCDKNAAVSTLAIVSTFIGARIECTDLPDFQRFIDARKQKSR